MHKVKAITLFIFLATLLFCAITLLANPATARELTSAEKKKFAQSSILFYVPCDTEADCEPPEEEGETVTPIEDPEDPDQPSGDIDTHTVAGPEGINISKEILF